MSLAARLTRSPRPFDPERGAEVRAVLADLGPEVAELVGGAAGCSPYLAGLLGREGDWLRGAAADPEAAVEAELARITELAPDALSEGLREAKRRLALLVALADLGGAWPLETVTGTLTRLADAAVGAALRAETAAAIARGRLPGLSADDAATAGGLTVLAMGKMGAFELNYSSDIDLICLFDEGRFSREDFPEARAGFVRVIRRVTALLSDATTEGYVFRTDLRLRPDASVTPVAMAMAGAEAYYESVGRTWERAAYIKARAAAGDVAAGERFLQTMIPFVWRKHLDFAAIQDAHDMRLRIRDHKGLGGRLSLPGHDLKLGRGGIREIEFFTQTRQLIAGGRDTSLRVRGTVEGLARLTAAGWVPQDVAQTLTRHYRAHREIEHRLQMLADAQTHMLPQLAEGWERLAAFLDTDREALEGALRDRLSEVHELTEGFFAPGEPRPRPRAFGNDVTERWQSYPALRSARAGEIFRRLLPGILDRLEEAARPEEALAAFDAFLAGLPAGVQLFSLFEANPELTRLVVEISATAPALARYLSRNAGVFDAVIGGSFFAPWPGQARLAEGLAAALGRESDYERKLDAARRWMKEWHFRVGVHHLQGLLTADEAGAQYADLAEAVIAETWPVVVDEFARKHGPPPGRGATVLAMGSLGARRLNALSDLDLIVIYDAGDAESSDGRRPLPVRTYFARATQALVTALSAPTAEGRLYEVDMRLRPSGRQGPVATSLAAYQGYQREEAWTWEHLALTRARPIAGEASLQAEVEGFRRELLSREADGAKIRADVAEMRARLAAAKPPQGNWDAKQGTGRLMEVELAAQTAALLVGSHRRPVPAQIDDGAAAGLLSSADAEALVSANALFWSLQAAARLLTGGTLRPQDLGEGGRRFVLRATGHADMDELERAMAEAAEAAGAAFDRLLSGGT